MTPGRRDFLRTTATAGLALGLGGVSTPLQGADGTGGRPGDRPGEGGPSRSPRSPRALRILVLGGTGFIGPHMVQYLIDRGHEVTLFNRGRSNTDLFPDLETLIGDRNDDLSALEGRSWDVCLDNNASRIPWVELSTEVLRDSVDRYFYVSSRSAYSDLSAVPMHAGAPTFTYETAGVPRDADPMELPYGLQKALCERRVMEMFGDRHCIVRPGLIIGPGDPTFRFPYWPVRIHAGGEVLAPGDGTDPIQIIDVRDLSEWMVRMAEDGRTGVYNGVGPAIPRPTAELLYGIRAVTTAETTFTWVPYAFLREQGLRPYAELPVWRPPLPGSEGFAQFDLTPELEAGLTFRPLADTASATLEYFFGLSEAERAEMMSGRELKRDREAEVLAAWHASRG